MIHAGSAGYLVAGGGNWASPGQVRFRWLLCLVPTALSLALELELELET